MEVSYVRVKSDGDIPHSETLPESPPAVTSGSNLGSDEPGIQKTIVWNAYGMNEKEEGTRHTAFNAKVTP
jgi:hypothetical protein